MSGSPVLAVWGALPHTAIPEPDTLTVLPSPNALIFRAATVRERPRIAAPNVLQ
jgi:hypothetical protein